VCVSEVCEYIYIGEAEERRDQGGNRLLSRVGEMTYGDFIAGDECYVQTWF
jgi:hypothetical protein